MSQTHKSQTISSRHLLFPPTLPSPYLHHPDFWTISLHLNAPLVQFRKINKILRGNFEIYLIIENFDLTISNAPSTLLVFIRIHIVLHITKRLIDPIPSVWCSNFTQQIFLLSLFHLFTSVTNMTSRDLNG